VWAPFRLGVLPLLTLPMDEEGTVLGCGGIRICNTSAHTSHPFCVAV
jgi:hypothetical protein